jgi:hypothetical protein
VGKTEEGECVTGKDVEEGWGCFKAFEELLLLLSNDED